MPTSSQLPSEILAQLFEHFTHPVPEVDKGDFPSPPELRVDRRTLSSLARVNKQFYQQAALKLWRHVQVSPFIHSGSGETKQDTLSIADTLLHSPRKQELLPLVQILQVCWSANHGLADAMLKIMQTCPNLSYLSLDFEHRGAGLERLPVEKLLDVLESMSSLRTLNLRFTEVDTKYHDLYVPACLRLRLPQLVSLRIKGVPTAIFDAKAVHPLPNLRHLLVNHFDFSSAQLANYIEILASESKLERLQLVDIEESSNILSLLPNRIHETVTHLTVALDDSFLDVKALAKFTVLRILDLGYAGISGQDLSLLPSRLVRLVFFPSTLELLVTLADNLREKGFLPHLESIHLTGAEEAFWDDGEASNEQWRDALATIASFEEVLKNRHISLSPTKWRGQLEARTAALEHNDMYHQTPTPQVVLLPNDGQAIMLV